MEIITNPKKKTKKKNEIISHGDTVRKKCKFHSCETPALRNPHKEIQINCFNIYVKYRTEGEKQTE